MSRRRPRRSAAQMLAWYLTACAVLGAVAFADELLRHGLLVALALAGPAAGYAIGKRRSRVRSRPAKVIQGRAEGGTEVNRLTIEVAELRQRVADAERARDAAWDAVAERPPRRSYATCDCPLITAHEGACPLGPGAPDKRAALLADPRSGARPLGGAR